jgi:hypothetical protein
MTITQLIKHAKTLHAGMGYKTFDKGQTNERTIAIFEDKEGSIHDELLNITFEVFEQCCLGMDSTYQFTMEALALIADCDATDENELHNLDCEIEADVYTGELTHWLAENINHVQYLTEVLERDRITDGIQAIMAAQVAAKTAVFNTVLAYLLK